MMLVDCLRALNVKIEENTKYQETKGHHNRNFKGEENIYYTKKSETIKIIYQTFVTIKQ